MGLHRLVMNINLRAKKCSDQSYYSYNDFSTTGITILHVQIFFSFSHSICTEDFNLFVSYLEVPNVISGDVDQLALFLGYTTVAESYERCVEHLLCS